MNAPRGNPKLDQMRNKDTSAANKRRTDLANDHAREMAKAMAKAMGEGISRPYRHYAEWLNNNGYRTRQGNTWTSSTVARLHKKVLDPAFPKT